MILLFDCKKKKKKKTVAGEDGETTFKIIISLYGWTDELLNNIIIITSEIYIYIFYIKSFLLRWNYVHVKT